MKGTIHAKGTEIAVISIGRDDDFISLTDIAKYKNSEFPADVVKNWMRSRSTIEFVGIWEKLNNPNFKLVEFDQFKNEAGSNAFVLNPQKWRDANPNLEGNMRDYAAIEQLLVLANIEGMNAEFIRMELSQPDRLVRLNQIAIRQVKTLTCKDTAKTLDFKQEAGKLNEKGDSEK